MIFGKKKTPEEELRDAEERRTRAQDTLNHLKDRLEVELEIAEMRIEAESVRAKLKNPEAEYRRQKEIPKPDLRLKK